jgi:hypothetical protein
MGAVRTHRQIPIYQNEMIFIENQNIFSKPIAKRGRMCYNDSFEKLKKIYAKIIYDLSRVAEGRAL